VTPAPARRFEGAIRNAHAIALCLLALPLAAHAWDSGALKPPGTGQSLGLSIGRSDYGLGCGLLPGCDKSTRALRLYGQAMVSDHWGAELGLLDMGRIGLGGGSARASGVNLSLLGRVPVFETFSLYGKLGTTYGHTTTSAIAGAGLRSGSEDGFGLSYGAGLSWNLSPRLSAVLEWDSHDFRFAGGGRDAVRATSLGLQYRY